MSIQLINNHNFSYNSISFSKRKEKESPDKTKVESNSKGVSAGKMVPAMIALAGLTTLGSCSEDMKYADLKDIKKDCFRTLESNEKSLAEVNEKQFVLDENTDSVYKESKEYTYSHIKINSKDHTRIMGKILRKEDGMAISFINVYDENDELTSSTIKDPKTKETFYVTYTNGFITKVNNKDGEQLNSSKYGKYILILLAGMGLYGGGKVLSGAFAPRMRDEDFPNIEPPTRED